MTTNPKETTTTMTHGWNSSTRKQRIGKSGWEEQRQNRRILTLHRGRCHVCGQPGAGQVDHVIPLSQGGQDTDQNKRPIHARPCHENKTRAESTAARSTNRPQRRRPVEPHPGLITPLAPPSADPAKGPWGPSASGSVRIVVPPAHEAPGGPECR